MSQSQPFRKQFPKPVRKSRLFCYNKIKMYICANSTSTFALFSSVKKRKTPQKLHSICQNKVKKERAEACSLIVFNLFYSCSKLLITAGDVSFSFIVNPRNAVVHYAFKDNRGWKRKNHLLKVWRFMFIDNADHHLFTAARICTLGINYCCSLL